MSSGAPPGGARFGTGSSDRIPGEEVWASLSAETGGKTGISGAVVDESDDSDDDDDEEGEEGEEQAEEAEEKVEEEEVGGGEADEGSGEQVSEVEQKRRRFAAAMSDVLERRRQRRRCQ